jgi:hypothetical protein
MIYYYLVAQIELSINTYLLDIGSRLILVDAGSAICCNPKQGSFPSTARLLATARRKLTLLR